MSNFQPIDGGFVNGQGTSSFPMMSGTQLNLLDQQLAPFMSDPLELGPFFNSDLHWWMPSQVHEGPKNA